MAELYSSATFLYLSTRHPSFSYSLHLNQPQTKYILQGQIPDIIASINFSTQIWRFPKF